jgi:hypothetical protein
VAQRILIARPSTKRSGRRRPIVLYRLTPWWAKVFAVWLASRAITTSLMLLFAGWQPKNPWTAAHPSYLAFSQFWDSGWYHTVAVSGYPSELPMTAAGRVAENAWAFLPGYPILVRALMVATTLPWEPVSVFVSVAFSLATALVFYRLCLLRLPSETALFSVVLFCVAPLSPILQVSYAESMYLFLLAVALYLLLRRRYGILVPVIAVMSLTRPSGLAFALALFLHVAHRWLTRDSDPFPTRDRVAALLLAGFSTLMSFAWTVIAWAVTGSATAYTDTELAWRAPYIGYGALEPFEPWLQGAAFWGALWHVGGLALWLLAVVILGFVAFLFTPTARRLGADIRIWGASYGLYLLAVFFPQSSTFRLLMPMFPLLGAVAQPRSTIYRVSVVALFIAGQFGWLYICWWDNGYDWTPP